MLFELPKRPSDLDQKLHEVVCITSYLEEVQMKKTVLTIPILASLALALPSMAAGSNWNELTTLTFETIESDADSAVSRSENSSFADDVFASMDDDGSGVLSLNEFCTWGFGLHETADNAEQTDAFEIAMQVVFTPWDQDANAQVNQPNSSLRI